jgi:ADP-ribose pyrophosphatase YjhB (NUDIX family)
MEEIKLGSESKDTYFIAVKVFLKKDGKLLIMKDNFGDWDLPGGRIKKDEFETPLEKIIERKMFEELGDNVRYTIGKPVVFMRHERVEQSPGNPAVRIFAIGYEGNLDSGEITLSKRHTEMLWADLDSFEPEKYFKGGWLKGMKEYLKIIK